MTMANKTPPHFHPLPVIGYPEEYYAKHIQQADQAGDTDAHAAYKVGQYVTLGLDPKKPWAEKMKCFRHTLKHHCVAPPDAEESLKSFYKKLADMVRRYAGQEAMRLAMQEHDGYSMRVSTGESREAIDDEADLFFADLLGRDHDCPECFTQDVWTRLKLLRDHWI